VGPVAALISGAAAKAIASNTDFIFDFLSSS
jgi:hypothetical protein